MSRNLYTNPAESCARQETADGQPRRLHDPWHPGADHSVTTKLAYAEPTRVVEMQRPGPLKWVCMTEQPSRKARKALAQKPKAAPVARVLKTANPPVELKQPFKQAPTKKAAPAAKRGPREVSASVTEALRKFNSHIVVLKQGGLTHKEAVAQASADRKAGLI